MRSLLAVAVLLQLSVQAFSQNSKTVSKPPLDTSVLGKWPELYHGQLTPNGKYISYVLEEHMPLDQITTVVQSPDGRWKKELKGISCVQFSGDSRSALYLNSDTLFCITLGTPQVITVESVLSYRLVPYTKGEWLVYQLKGAGKELIIQDEKTKKQRRFTQVEAYSFSKNGGALVLESKGEEEKESTLRWIDLTNDKELSIWSGADKPVQIIFDETNTQIAFTTEEGGKRSVWHYIKTSEKAELIVKDGDPSIDSGLYIGSLEKFSKDRERVFFNLERRYLIQPLKPDAANVNVWRYNDIKLQSEQLDEIAGKKQTVKNYYSGINLDHRKAFRIQQDFDWMSPERPKSEDYTLVLQLSTDQDVGIGIWEFNWNPTTKDAVYYLVSSNDGGRKKLPLNAAEIFIPSFSPDGKFIIYRPYSMLHYFTYEIATGEIRNITSKIITDLVFDNCYENVPIKNQQLLSIPGWLKGDAGVLVYDHNDLWLVDPLAKRPTECITNGYGKRNGLIFRKGVDAYNQEKVFSYGEKLVLLAFNKRTKENGHYSKVIGQKGDPTKINMEMSLYAVNTGKGSDGGNIDAANPVKGKSTDVYLIKKQTVSDFPNYYYTTDLKHFQQVTFLSPEKKYNWMTTELHTWVAPDGDTLQGVLYKPENFDRSKKYPVLFSIYRQFSDEVNEYQIPNWTTDRINIPWFISRGYLVFTPDIHYKNPKLKESVLNCVVSAAKYISSLPFVDSTRLGIQGHSFGGVEMGYVVTGTDLFAAASSMAGSYDFISEAGTILLTGDSRQGWFENTFIYSNLWQNKEAFINNSAIFDADKAKTPFLIVGGEQDGVKPNDQNIELFLGLRRLGKPAWLLTYENEAHAIRKKENKRDYTIRITQFFDHYLHKTPPSLWMTKGVPARFKGLLTGYEIDSKNKCQKDCPICN